MKNKAKKKVYLHNSVFYSKDLVLLLVKIAMQKKTFFCNIAREITALETSKRKDGLSLQIAL